jgi:hypothetical protein
MNVFYLWWQSKENIWIWLKDIYWHFKRMWNYRYLHYWPSDAYCSLYKLKGTRKTGNIPSATYYRVYINPVFMYTHKHTHILIGSMMVTNYKVSPSAFSLDSHYFLSLSHVQIIFFQSPVHQIPQYYHPTELRHMCLYLQTTL